MVEPLNPFLYNRLAKCFGHKPVIAKAGEQYVETRGLDGRAVVVSSGEYYRINCPSCRFYGTPDRRKRLWISYMWGVPDDNGRPRWWLAHCFRNSCLQEPAHLDRLKNLVYYSAGLRAAVGIDILPGRVVEPKKAEWPGECVRIDQLRSDHVAVRYIAERGFDPDYIGKQYGVAFCFEAKPEYSAALGRLIIPVFMHGELVNWQARYLGETDWKYVPKYINCPGVPKKTVIYNYDLAKHFPFVVVCEGIISSWRVGANAVALLGKSLSLEQAELLASTWEKIIILLDSDAERDALKAKLMLGRRAHVAVAKLDEGLDPDSAGLEASWDAIYKAALREKMELEL